MSETEHIQNVVHHWPNLCFIGLQVSQVDKIFFIKIFILFLGDMPVLTSCMFRSNPTVKTR